MQHCERITKGNRKRQANATALRLPDMKSFLSLKLRHKVLYRRLKRHFLNSHLTYFLSKMRIPPLEPPLFWNQLRPTGSILFHKSLPTPYFMICGWPSCTSRGQLQPQCHSGSSGGDEAAGSTVGICNGCIHHGINERPSNRRAASQLAPADEYGPVMDLRGCDGCNEAEVMR